MTTEDMIGHRLVGSGPQKVVILHGWWGDYTAYDAMLPYLNGARFTYAFMDYRGYGKSVHRAGDHTIEQIAEDAIALAETPVWLATIMEKYLTKNS